MSRATRAAAGAIALAAAIAAWPEGLGRAGALPDPAADAAVPAARLRIAAPPSVPVAALAAAQPAGPPRPPAPDLPAALGRAVEAAARRAAGPEAASDRRGPRSLRHVTLLAGAGILRPRGEAFRVGEVEHAGYRLHKQGLPVFNRRGRLHSTPDGPLPPTGAMGTPALAPGGFRIGPAEALARAEAAAGVRARRGAPRVERGWLAHGAATVPAFRVQVPSLVPFASFEATLDARSGEVLLLVDRLASADGSGSVFDPNPLQAPGPSTVALEALDGSGSLSGAFTRVFDLVAPSAFRPRLDFLFPPGDARFVQTSVYWTLTRAGRLAVAHGLPPFPEPVVSYTNLRRIDGSEYNNAFYDPLTPAFWFGNGDGTVLANLGTDADVAAHEMGHHVFEVLVTPEIGSAADPVLAIAEGVADTWSALANGDPRIGEATVPGRAELRRLDLPFRFPDDEGIDPHQTGLIFGSVNWDLIGLLGAGRFASALVRALPFLPPDAEHLDYQGAFQTGARRLLPASRRAKLLRQVRRTFARHGFGELVPPPEFRGDLLDGIPAQDSLRDKRFHFYLYLVPPGAERVDFRTTGTGDADLVVIGPGTDPDDPSTYRQSSNPGTSEFVQITRFTRPSVADPVLGVLVLDYPDRRRSRYELRASSTLAAPPARVDGPPFLGSLDVPGEIDFVNFAAAQDQLVRLDVTALSPGLDLVAGVFDPKTFELLDADDDDGPGLDPLLQGVRIPAAGTYTVAVLALFDDFDPAHQTGAYQVTLATCANAGGDLDGDGLHDACDDDDDGDGFDDGEDGDPADPLACADIDLDGCDDCSGGSFDVRADGPDADGDAQCDAGDLDDDNDGCDDTVDPAPATPSVDLDLDFLGEDCDACPRDADPLQEDLDGDGVGDACAACVPLQWTDPPLAAPARPDQNPRGQRYVFSYPLWPGRQAIAISGDFDFPLGGPTADPATNGIHVRLEDGRGLLLDVNLPGGFVGTSPCDPGDGWDTSVFAPAPLPFAEVVHEYRNVSGALPPLCVPGSAGGIESVIVPVPLPGARGLRTPYSITARNLDLGRTPDTSRLRFTLALEPQPAPGVASAAAKAGQCADALLPSAASALDCDVVKTRKRKRNPAARILAFDCKGP